MTKDSTSKTPEKTKKTDAAGSQMKIRWDESNMSSAYSNVFNAIGTREEIVLFFGMNQAWDSAQKQVTVQLSDRIVLSPFTAKRLSVMLQNVIREYESKYGALEVEADRPVGTTVQ